MTDDRWARVDGILQAALVRPADGRERFVSEACGDDAALCDEVMSLLAHAGSADGFLEPVAAGTGARLEPGQTLGPYTIGELIGAGGMGEVYRARDPRLGRDVAIKILPAAVSADQGRLRRFEQEARAAGALNHPNIVTLHDIGEHDGIRFLVLELVEGETLVHRLERGPLSLNDVLVYGAEIASALDRAHRHGIVHRDLKPANVMLTRNGAKLIDFGLAKLRTAAPVGSSMTQVTGLTSEGAIVGTVAYMSPEQAQGGPTDHRTDIFALGVMLYESATGVRPFQGATNLEVLSSILRDTPKPVTDLNAILPRDFSRIVRRCLEKDPELRYQSARDIQHDLIDTKQQLQSGDRQFVPAPAARPRFQRAIPVVALAAVVAGVGLVTWLWPQPGAAVTARRVLDVTPPAALDGYLTGNLAISPNGERLAFIAPGAGGRRVLWVRSLDEPTSHQLAGTEGAAWLFWSADSLSLGFVAESKLKTIAVSGGESKPLHDAAGFGGTWNRENVILFRPRDKSVIHRMPADGGTPAAVTALDEKAGDTEHGFPFFLPDGRHFLYSAATRKGGRAAIYVGSLEPTERGTLLIDGAGNAQYSSGYLLFLQDSTLMAQAFDPDRRTFSGEPKPQTEHVATGTGTFGGGAYSVSETGDLVYHSGPGAEPRPLNWFDRTGAPTGSSAGHASGDLELSPEGTRAAVRVFRDIWIVDLARGGSSPFTSDTTSEHMPVWSPDGRIAFTRSTRGGLLPGGDLFVKAADGAGAEAVLLQDNQEKFPTSWSSDGHFLLYSVAGGAQRNLDIWVLPLSGQRPFPIVQTTRFDERDGQFSRDGKWIAYVSNENESDRPEVFVRPFPGPGAKERVSFGGGDLPRWRADGKEIFYVAPGDKLMATSVNGRGAKFEVGAEERLFDLRPGGFRPTKGRYFYDVKSDGQQFLVITELEHPLTPLRVVLNWAAGLAKK